MLGIYLALLTTPEEKSRFEHLYIAYKNVLYNYAYAILNDVQLSEDAVSEAFLILVDHMNKIEGRSDQDARNYLIIIVKNAARAIRNKRKNDLYDEEGLAFVPDSQNIELEAELKDEKQRVYGLIKQLKPMYADVLILKYYYDMKGEEIASSLGITLENVKIRLHRGKAMLKEAMERENEYDGQSV